MPKAQPKMKTQSKMTIKGNPPRLILGPIPLVSCVLHIVNAVPKFRVDDIVASLNGKPFTIFQVRVESLPREPHRYTAFYRGEGSRIWTAEVKLRLIAREPPRA